MTEPNPVKALVDRIGHARLAARMGVAEATVYRWIRTGTAPSQARTRKALAAAKAKLAKAGGK